MKVSAAAVASATVVAVLGAAGLILGQTSAGSATTTGPGRVSVVDAYVRAPVPPTKLAAGYFTVYNTTAKPDRLLNVQTGAGATATLHVVGANGDMSAMSANGVEVPAHGTFTLSTGRSHVMIGQLFGPVVAGQTVDMTVQFQNAGTINVVAPVIAVGAPVPAAAEPAGQSSRTMNMSGDHS
ncbi:copper chaperone PCu(A)C [uncultured Jatrophihabitans sp.]|uniref:copper chaperone PCu(A)C n=1 Tax=uncultured Jatrophihabitans sp. TaxID=1610747 RepID=UPI0035CC4C0D